MMYDPGFRLQTIKRAQQEHRDIATDHRHVRSSTKDEAADLAVRRSPRIRLVPRRLRPLTTRLAVHPRLRAT
jgi:hypothetical protein